MGRGAWRATVHGVMVGYSPRGRQELETTEVTQHACMDCVLTLHERLEEK